MQAFGEVYPTRVSMRARLHLAMGRPNMPLFGDLQKLISRSLLQKLQNGRGLFYLV